MRWLARIRPVAVCSREPDRKCPTSCATARPRTRPRMPVAQQPRPIGQPHDRRGAVSASRRATWPACTVMCVVGWPLEEQDGCHRQVALVGRLGGVGLDEDVEVLGLAEGRPAAPASPPPTPPRRRPRATAPASRASARRARRATARRDRSGAAAPAAAARRRTPCVRSARRPPRPVAGLASRRPRSSSRPPPTTPAGAKAHVRPARPLAHHAPDFCWKCGPDPDRGRPSSVVPGAHDARSALRRIAEACASFSLRAQSSQQTSTVRAADRHLDRASSSGQSQAAQVFSVMASSTHPESRVRAVDHPRGPALPGSLACAGRPAGTRRASGRRPA